MRFRLQMSKKNSSQASRYFFMCMLYMVIQFHPRHCKSFYLSYAKCVPIICGALLQKIDLLSFWQVFMMQVRFQVYI